MMPPAAVLHRYGLSNPEPIAETGIAHVWKVTQAGGTPAALKIYKDNDPKGEETGFTLMQALDGAGAARVYHFDHHIAVLEWLDGASLGDLSRNGQDDLATKELIAVADRIHAALPRVQPPTLRDKFRALLNLRIDTAWPHPVQQDVIAARQIALHLLDHQTDIRALHGDLHHDNIKHSPRGYLAFDAKGMIGL